MKKILAAVFMGIMAVPSIATSQVVIDKNGYAYIEVLTGDDHGALRSTRCFDAGKALSKEISEWLGSKPNIEVVSTVPQVDEHYCANGYRHVVKGLHIFYKNKK